VSTTQKSSLSARSASSRTTFCVDDEVLGLWVLCRARRWGVRGVLGGEEIGGAGHSLEPNPEATSSGRRPFTRTRRWGVPGGEEIGRIGYGLEPSPEATSSGRRPLDVNPSQAE
jgi:hypothetical protein